MYPTNYTIILQIQEKYTKNKNSKNSKNLSLFLWYFPLLVVYLHIKRGEIDPDFFIKYFAIMTHFQNRIAASEQAFCAPNHVPSFTMEQEVFTRYYVTTTEKLPLIAPYSKESHSEESKKILGDLFLGIERCIERGTYVFTVFTFFEKQESAIRKEIQRIIDEL